MSNYLMNVIKGGVERNDYVVCVGADCDIYGNGCIVMGMNCRVYGGYCIVTDKTSTIMNRSSKYIWDYESSITCKKDDSLKSVLSIILQEVNTNSGMEVSGDNDEINECSVCLDMKRNVLFLPCRHVTSCAQCVRNEVMMILTKTLTENYENGFKCGICASDVKKVYRMFN